MRQLNYFNPDERKYHPKAEKLAQFLCNHCENESPMFFRMIVSYHLSKIASEMRATVKTHKQANLPINMYTVNLAPSGAGKTKAMNFMEEQVTNLFAERFKEELLPEVTEINMAKLAVQRANRNGTDDDAELSQLRAEFGLAGEWMTSFDSATPAALKQFRQKLLLANAGALNFEIDEIGDNLTGNAEAYSKFLELYDKGKIKGSLVKNTRDNVRMSEIKGGTPCNLIMFGTGSSLLDASKTEEEFFKMLEKGYARRCFFAYTNDVVRDLDMSVEDIYDRNVEKSANAFIDDFSEELLELADSINFNKTLGMDKNEEYLLLEYQMHCMDRANTISQYNFIERAEMEHRYFKTLKLAAVYAFIDSSSKITADHLYYAITIAEESGAGIGHLLNREMPYVKLARYLGEAKRPVTQVELHEYLPFYRGAKQHKEEMLDYAISHGYQNNIIIKKQFHDGIMFLHGESLQETNLDELTVSYSDHMAYNYFNDAIKWENLEKLTQMKDMHWVAHHVNDGHRCEDKIIPGTNLLVLDIDGEVPLSSVQQLLKEYKSIIYTTKRHGITGNGCNGEDRFRVIIPMKYTLKLDGNDYKEFMQGVYQWLPFHLDESTGQRSRKWACYDKGDIYTNDGELFDPVEFIPKTSKNEKRKEKLLDQSSLNNLERWFINNTGQGNRSNQLIKYALLLVDSGKTMVKIEQAVNSLNDKLQDSLPDEEITNTIMLSARRAFNKSVSP